MTLNTKVALTGRIAPDAARDLAAKALLSAANNPDLGDNIQWETQRAGTLPHWLADRDDLGPDQIKAWVEPCDKVRSVPGQGLPGIIQIRTSPTPPPPADAAKATPPTTPSSRGTAPTDTATTPDATHGPCTPSPSSTSTSPSPTA